MSPYDETDALVPHGVDVLRRPGITLIPAPTVSRPEQTQESSAPSQPAKSAPVSPGGTRRPPTKHSVQPKKASTAAAKTPAAAEATAKGTTATSCRPTAFETSTKAKPNAALIEASHRQGGTVAHPVSAAETTKPAPANSKRHQTTKAGKTPLAANAMKHAVSAAPAPKHPATAAVPTYYTYKKDVHLKPGQALAYTPGKGYHAMERTGSSGPIGKAERTLQGIGNPPIPARSARPITKHAGDISFTLPGRTYDRGRKVVVVVSATPPESGEVQGTGELIVSVPGQKSKRANLVYGTTSVTIVVAPGRRITATTMRGILDEELPQPRSKKDESDDQLRSVGGRELIGALEPKSAEEQFPPHPDLTPGAEAQTAHATVGRLGKYYWWRS